MEAIVVTGQSNAKGTGHKLIQVMPNHLIINTAEGGTSIEEWGKGTALYNRAVQQVFECLRSGNRIVGMFHFQGEGNTNSIKKAKNYKKATVEFFNKFRLQCGLTNVPLVFAQLGLKPTSAFPEYTYWEFIQSQQRNISHQFPTYKMIKTYDINPYCPANGVHWCEEGYTLIANRVRKALLNP